MKKEKERRRSDEGGYLKELGTNSYYFNKEPMFTNAVPHRSESQVHDRIMGGEGRKNCEPVITDVTKPVTIQLDSAVYIMTYTINQQEGEMYVMCLGHVCYASIRGGKE